MRSIAKLTLSVFLAAALSPFAMAQRDPKDEPKPKDPPGGIKKKDDSKKKTPDSKPAIKKGNPDTQR